MTRLPERIAGVRERIDAACARASRDPSEITLVAVTKTFPLDVLRAVLDAGLSDLGENRALEFAEKAEALGDQPTWHFIGSLQRNKAREVAEHADLFHALDSRRLAKELNKRAKNAGRALPCLIQVNISGEDAKHGVAPGALAALLDEVAAFEHIDVRGLMGMAELVSPDEQEAVVRPQFARLRQLAESIGRDRLPLLSMGMSGDFEIAIEEGATHIRVGSALVGRRGD